MADLDEFRGALRGCTDTERRALLKMLSDLRDKYAGGDNLRTAFAAVMNAAVWAVVDLRKEVAEDRKQFDRMMVGVLNGADAADFTVLPSAFDK